MPQLKNFLLLCFACLPLSAAGLAPTGTLRATFLANNPVQATVDAKTGEVSGPAADIVKELARREGVPYTIIPANGAKELIELLKAKKADIGFLAWEAERARQVDFSGAYSLMGSSYLVPAASSVKTVADADRMGMRIGAIEGQSPTIFLHEHLRFAKIKPYPSVPSPKDLQKQFEAREIDAFAGNRARLVEAAAQNPALRVATDNFTVLEQAIVVDKGDTARLQIINQFLNEVRASNFIKDSLARAKLAGVDPAPNKNR
jgi:polar amino acid transport system substrate-binding protein